MGDKPYKVNLPSTSFSQRANAGIREPEIQKFWMDRRVYERNLERRSASPRFLLHDGPPYLSAPRIHIGTALNKVLKDFVTRHMAMRGFYAPFVPGYDSHGLPIENAALKEVKGGRAAVTPLELRKRCRDLALANLAGQRRAFERLGVWGDFDHPYVTLQKEFEAAQLRVFAKMSGKGLLYRGTKPVHWCPRCETALADAEVEPVNNVDCCWRCKTALEQRTTPQWFASVDACRADALAAVDSVKWLPESGRNRIKGMVQDRGDWCVSRQRAWGVPVPAFYCEGCNEHLMTEQSVECVAAVFEREGSDAWWQHDAHCFLGGKFECKCGGKVFRKETDTMDVWFDSGVTHAAVVDLRPELRGTPVELYLEGSDQHRGWFQSSLWTSVAVHGRAPYKTVLTHGFVVDEKGRKMSKSEGNVVDPEDVIKQYGADVLRLWVASVNYTDDTPCGKNVLAQLAKVYEKLRNTMRFLLSNLNDFDPSQHRVPHAELKKVDAFMLHKLAKLVEQTQTDFDNFEFFKFYQALQNFCVVDLSSFYFDTVKDRLYTHAADSVSRRAAQTVLEYVLQAMVRLVAPVTPHLAEDVWQHMPEAVRVSGGGAESVLLTDYPSEMCAFRNDELEGLMTELLAVRAVSFKALELARSQKLVGKPQEARMVLVFDDKELEAKVRGFGDELGSLLMTSQVEVAEAFGTPLCADVANSNETPFSSAGKRTAHQTAAGPDKGKTNSAISASVAEKNSATHTSAAEVGTADGAQPEAMPLSEARENGVHAYVLRAHGSKCARCWNYRQSVGSSAAAPELCVPCIDVEGVL